MTDNEIIKVWGKLYNTSISTTEFQVINVEGLRKFGVIIKATLDLINRQKAEIERLEKVEHFADKTIATQQAEIERLKTLNSKLEAENYSFKVKERENPLEMALLIDEQAEQLKTAKAEAIKEFAERLKEEIDIRPTHSNKQNKFVFFLIDNLVKEMVGDADEVRT